MCQYDHTCCFQPVLDYNTISKVISEDSSLFMDWICLIHDPNIVNNNSCDLNIRVVNNDLNHKLAKKQGPYVCFAPNE